MFVKGASKNVLRLLPVKITFLPKSFHVGNLVLGTLRLPSATGAESCG